MGINRPYKVGRAGDFIGVSAGVTVAVEGTRRRERYNVANRAVSSARLSLHAIIEEDYLFELFEREIDRYKLRGELGVHVFEYI